MRKSNLLGSTSYIGAFLKIFLCPQSDYQYFVFWVPKYLFLHSYFSVQDRLKYIPIEVLCLELYRKFCQNLGDLKNNHSFYNIFLYNCYITQNLLCFSCQCSHYRYMEISRKVLAKTEPFLLETSSDFTPFYIWL